MVRLSHMILYKYIFFYYHIPSCQDFFLAIKTMFCEKDIYGNSFSIGLTGSFGVPYEIKYTWTIFHSRQQRGWKTKLKGTLHPPTTLCFVVPASLEALMNKSLNIIGARGEGVTRSGLPGPAGEYSRLLTSF